VRPVLETACAAFLIQLTPFIVFLQYHRYPYADPGSLICLLALALLALALGALASRSRVLQLVVLAGLLTLLADLQFHPPKGVIGLAVIFVGLVGLLWVLRQHAVRIVTATMAAMLLSSILLPTQSAATRADHPAAVTRHGDGPLILHLILDEQIGIEGYPADISAPAFRAHLRSFFVNRGFLLFGRAFSEYFKTYRSIAALVNFKPGEFVRGLLSPGRTGLPWDLTKNAYFARLTDAGYAIRVYQPDFLNFCAKPGPTTSCQTYAATSLGALAPVSLPAAQKAPIIASMYLDRSNAYAFVRHLYNAGRAWLRAKGHRLPPWNWERNRLSPLSSMTALSMVAKDLSQARRGQVLFAHLLLPHYPYVYDRKCRVRPPREWLERMDHADAPAGSINSASGRELRYARYVEQVECVQGQLDQLIRAIPETLRRDAIIVIHGDHGSRIVRTEPDGERQLSGADYTDSYSTLFAVKSPWLHAGYDRRMVSITCLMRALAQSDFHSVDGLDVCTGSPVVSVSDDEWIARPLSPFGEPPGQLHRGSSGASLARTSPQ
jgi:hypothetical protein